MSIPPSPLPLPPPPFVYPIIEVLSSYQQYEHLYVKDCEKTIGEFQASNPHPSEYEAQVDRYERLEMEIKDLPSTKHLNAAILLDMG